MNKILRNVLISILKFVFNILFGVLDKDSDGKLSQEELLEIHNIITEFYTKIMLFMKKD